MTDTQRAKGLPTVQHEFVCTLVCLRTLYHCLSQHNVGCSITTYVTLDFYAVTLIRLDIAGLEFPCTFLPLVP